MITAGIDMGAKFVKAAILQDGRLVGKGRVAAGFDAEESANEALTAALQEAGVRREDLDHITATGVGRKEISLGQDEITEVGASSKGANYLYPSVRTVIDVGCEEGRAIKCDGTGKVLDFAINEKCAAGAGAFTEAMARALEIPLEEMGPLSLKSQQAVPMNAQCAVFAESEVVSLIHNRTPKEDIARAVHDAISSRISSMARRVGLEPDVAVVGGLARNVGFLKSLQDDLQLELRVPEEVDYAGALGAALVAAERAQAKGGAA